MSGLPFACKTASAISGSVYDVDGILPLSDEAALVFGDALFNELHWNPLLGLTKYCLIPIICKIMREKNFKLLILNRNN